jgi:hypothetical protein
MAGPLRRGEYCRQQALECAAAAAATRRCEINEAYLHLEQGWLRLAPEINDSQILVAHYKETAVERQRREWKRRAPRGLADKCLRSSRGARGTALDDPRSIFGLTLDHRLGPSGLQRPLAHLVAQ